jgi:hypothetical protein
MRCRARIEKRARHRPLNPVATSRPKKRHASSEGIGLLEESGFPHAVSPKAEQ